MVTVNPAPLEPLEEEPGVKILQPFTKVTNFGSLVDRDFSVEVETIPEKEAEAIEASREVHPTAADEGEAEEAPEVPNTNPEEAPQVQDPFGETIPAPKKTLLQQVEPDS